MSGFKKFRQNIYCNTYTLQSIDIGFLQFLKSKNKIYFVQKLHFSYLLAHEIKEVRENQELKR
jgi:hypothetical protein